MTSMIEKPVSKKAKSFNRFNGTQDHGDAHAPKGHEDNGYWEKRWKERGSVNMGKTTMKEALREGFLEANSDALEAEADRILREAEMDQEAEDTLHEFNYVEDRRWRPGDERAEHIDGLLAQYRSLYLQVLEMKKMLEANPTDEMLADDINHLEARAESLEDELRAATREDAPTIGEAGGRTDKEIRDSMARAATLDTYEGDDFGDYSDSHIRISNRPR